MGYGDRLDFDPSGEKKITRGIKPCQLFDITFDNNGQPKPVALRNHPRRIAGPHGSHYFGANNDTQFLLIAGQHSPDEALDKRRHLEIFSNNLVAAGVAGLEHNNACFICEQYLSSYQCKGDLSSKD